jgi:hypothetical protein
MLLTQLKLMMHWTPAQQLVQRQDQRKQQQQAQQLLQRLCLACPP